MNTHKIGIDIGSTTAKIVVLSHDGDVIYSRYERHQAAVYPLIYTFLEEVSALTGDTPCTISITGSVGMGVAERCGLPFVQEVVAATKFVTELYPSIRSIIDIGGEDAKVVFLHKDRPVDLRMNGNCAGGTGAFIDQMAVLLGTSVDDMSNLAYAPKQSTRSLLAAGFSPKPMYRIFWQRTSPKKMWLHRYSMLLPYRPSRPSPGGATYHCRYSFAAGR